MLCPTCKILMKKVPGSVEETANYKSFTEECPLCKKKKSHTWKKAEPSRNGSYSRHGQPTKGNAYGRTSKWGR